MPSNHTIKSVRYEKPTLFLNEKKTQTVFFTAEGAENKNGLGFACMANIKPYSYNPDLSTSLMQESYSSTQHSCKRLILFYHCYVMNRKFPSSLFLTFYPAIRFLPAQYELSKTSTLLSSNNSDTVDQYAPVSFQRIGKQVGIFP